MIRFNVPRQRYSRFSHTVFLPFPTHKIFRTLHISISINFSPYIEPPKKCLNSNQLDSTQPPQLPIYLLESLVLVLTKTQPETPNRFSSVSTLLHIHALSDPTPIWVSNIIFNPPLSLHHVSSLSSLSSTEKPPKNKRRGGWPGGNRGVAARVQMRMGGNGRGGWGFNISTRIGIDKKKRGNVYTHPYRMTL